VVKKKANLDHISSDYFRNIVKNYVNYLLALDNFNVIGIILFGSVARDEGREKLEDLSDVDLLIIFKDHDLPEKYVKRVLLESELMSDIDQGVDVLWWTLSELYSALTIKLPLILDIIDEGIIIFDPKNVLKPARNTLLQELKEKKVEKLNDGWLWPLKHFGDKIFF
jgi:predicted nucleotidyltransferase